MKKIAVSFGDGTFRWRNSSKRLKRELFQLGTFDDVIIFNLPDLLRIDTEVGRFVIDLLIAGDRKGCGYWIWKSSIILWVKNRYPNHMICYLDAGFSIQNTKDARDQFDWLFKKALEAKGLVLQLPNHTERQYSKSLVLDLIDSRKVFVETNQVQAGFIVITPDTPSEIFERWRGLMLKDDGLLVKDYPRGLSDPQFIAHRNDQSIFSLLWKQYGLGTVPDMTDPSSGSSAIIASRYASGFMPKNTDSMARLIRAVEKLFSQCSLWFLEPIRLRILKWTILK